MSIKYVVVVQCDFSMKRCSGFHCAYEFNNRTSSFTPYDTDTKYISITCGGCCGKGLSPKLENLAKCANKKSAISKDEIAIHLASCITNDNFHADRCMFTEYMKKLIKKKGFENVVEGSYVSKTATKRREENCYKTY